MSDSKISKFGMSFINKIKEYCSNNSPPVKTIDELLLLHPMKPASQPVSSGTQNQSAELFNGGKSVVEVATCRYF